MIIFHFTAIMAQIALVVGVTVQLILIIKDEIVNERELNQKED